MIIDVKLKKWWLHASTVQIRTREERCSPPTRFRTGARWEDSERRYVVAKGAVGGVLLPFVMLA
jgi:hypothetical protein